jgi:hypothetical protein
MKRTKNAVCQFSGECRIGHGVSITHKTASFLNPITLTAEPGDKLSSDVAFKHTAKNVG